MNSQSQVPRGAAAGMPGDKALGLDSSNVSLRYKWIFQGHLLVAQKASQNNCPKSMMSVESWGWGDREKNRVKDREALAWAFKRQNCRYGCSMVLAHFKYNFSLLGNDFKLNIINKF